MKRVINLDNWNRKEHFKFFSALDDPFWGITMTVDFTSIYQQSKNMEVSFFLYSVHFLLKCINPSFYFSQILLIGRTFIATGRTSRIITFTGT